MTAPLSAQFAGGLPDTRDVFNVTAYGADITGVADSTAATRLAVVAAAANVTATGRQSCVYFPSGSYSYRLNDGLSPIPIDGLSKLIFLGAPSHRSRLTMNGDAGGGDWYLFRVVGNSSDIEFRGL